MFLLFRSFPFVGWIGYTRFDVRAELTDVSKHEAPPGGYDNRLEYLNASEQRAEQLCEEERYYSLYNNDFEEQLYKGKFAAFMISKWFD